MKADMVFLVFLFCGGFGPCLRACFRLKKIIDYCIALYFADRNSENTFKQIRTTETPATDFDLANSHNPGEI